MRATFCLKLELFAKKFGEHLDNQVYKMCTVYAVIVVKNHALAHL